MSVYTVKQEVVPFQDIEEVLAKLRDKNGSPKGDQNFWDEAGWTGSSTTHKFKVKGQAPLKALRSLQGLLLTNSSPPLSPSPSPPMIVSPSPFSVEELVDLLLALRGVQLPESNRHTLLKKIVQQIQIPEEK